MYIKTLSNLTGCLQFMRGSESYEGDEDSDEEEIKETLYKAAELEVWIAYGLKIETGSHFTFSETSILLCLSLTDHESMC
jgi:hypothetical protein